MSPLAVGLLVVAAFFHAGWNLLARQAPDPLVQLWWALLAVGLLLTPSLALLAPPPAEVVALVLAASVVDAAQFTVLMKAYRIGDFALVYPISRGSAPLFLAAWGYLILGERPSAAGWLGIGLVVLGLAISGSTARGPKALGPRQPRLAVGLALLSGLAISVYSILNKVSLAALPPPTLTGLFHFGTAIALTPYLVHSRGAKLLLPVRRDARHLAMLISLLAASTTLVQTALSIERASYVGAVREVSVVVGALAGWLLLGEPLGHRRTAAAVVIFAGLMLIAVLG